MGLTHHCTTPLLHLSNTGNVPCRSKNRSFPRSDGIGARRLHRSYNLLVALPL